MMNMYKIIYGFVEFEVRGTYKTWLGKEKDFIGVKQVYIEPILIKLEDCDMCVNNLHNDIMRDIEDDLENNHYLHSYEYESYSKIYRNITKYKYIGLKTPVDTKDVTDVTVEKLREISNIEQFVEIENYYKNKLSAKENINAK